MSTRRSTVRAVTSGDQVRALRQRMGLTQERLGELCDLPRTKIVEIESGTNKAGSWMIRRRLATGFRLHVETMADLLDGVITVDEAELRARAGEGGARSGRLRERPEWPEALVTASAAASVTDPDLRQEDFDRVGLLYDGDALPRTLSARILVQLTRALRPA